MLASGLLGLGVTIAWYVCTARAVRIAWPPRRVVVSAAWATVVSGAALLVITATEVVRYLVPGDPPPYGAAGLALIVAVSVLALSSAIPSAFAAHRIAR